MGARTIRTTGRLKRIGAGAAAIAALALAPAPAAAWGYYGHQTIADIALANATPAVRAEVRRLLAKKAALGTPECAAATLGEAANWPDCIRRDGWRWGYTFAWHYQTEPVCEVYDPKANCAGGNCVFAQIERNYRLLADRTLPDNVRVEALAFLAHFVGDIHMPLHSGDDGDKGGNDVIASYGIVPDMNLHWMWDGALAERAISAAQPTLVRRYSLAERAELGGGTAADWGRESHDLARDVVYPLAFGRSPCGGDPLPDHGALSNADIEQALPVAERRVTQAGLRLAEMLNRALG